MFIVAVLHVSISSRTSNLWNRSVQCSSYRAIYLLHLAACGQLSLEVLLLFHHFAWLGREALEHLTIQGLLGEAVDLDDLSTRTSLLCEQRQENPFKRSLAHLRIYNMVHSQCLARARRTSHKHDSCVTATQVPY